MIIKPTEPPRTFEVGLRKKLWIKDCAHVALEPDEQVTFTTPGGAEYDVARKSWGFYATPSLNGRLPRLNLRPVLIKNMKKQYFVYLVEKGKETDFQTYIEAEAQTVVSWLDTTEQLNQLASGVKRKVS